MRSSLSAHSPQELALGHWLRPVYRADPNLVLSAPDVAPEAWRVPLRAWYPIELFDCRCAGDEHTVADDDLVSDTRLADALDRLRATGELALPVPDLVDDAEYAVECAALGETSLAPLETYVADLERRLAALEARLWPRARRALRQVLRRSGLACADRREASALRAARPSRGAGTQAPPATRSGGRRTGRERSGARRRTLRATARPAAASRAVDARRRRPGRAGSTSMAAGTSARAG